MTRRTRRMTFAIIGAIVLLVAITPFVMDVNQFRPFIEGKASAALGRQVDLGNLKLSLSSASLTTETLVIADDPAFSSTPFLEARSVSVGVELLPLILSRALEVTTISIESPQVNNLDFKMVATVTARLHGGMGSMVGTSGAIGDAVGAVGDVIGALTRGGTGGSKGRSQRVPFLVEGTTSDPRFVPDLSGLVIPALMNQL